MYETWRRTSWVFAIQSTAMVTMFAAFYLTGTARPWFSTVVTVAMGLVIISLLDTHLKAHLAEAIIAAATAILACVRPGLVYDLHEVLGIIIGVGVTWIAATRSQADTFGLRFIAALPLGVGTLFGGMVLLWRANFFLGRIPQWVYIWSVVATGVIAALALVLGPLTTMGTLALVLVCTATAMLAAALIHGALSLWLLRLISQEPKNKNARRLDDGTG